MPLNPGEYNSKFDGNRGAGSVQFLSQNLMLRAIVIRGRWSTGEQHGKVNSWLLHSPRNLAYDDKQMTSRAIFNHVCVESGARAHRSLAPVHVSEPIWKSTANDTDLPAICSVRPFLVHTHVLFISSFFIYRISIDHFLDIRKCDEWLAEVVQFKLKVLLHSDYVKVRKSQKCHAINNALPKFRRATKAS